MADTPPPFDPSAPSTIASGAPAFNPDAPSQVAGPAGAKIPEPTGVMGGLNRAISLIPGAGKVGELGRGVSEEFSGTYGKRQETPFTALGATLAQLVRMPYDAAKSTVEGMEKGGEALAGRGEYRPGDIAPPETTQSLVNLAGVRAAGLASPASLNKAVAAIPGAATSAADTAATIPGKVAEAAKSLRTSPEDAAAQKATATAEKAAKKVSKSLSGGGAPAGQDIIEELGKAKKTGQPLTLADIESPDIKNMIGNIYRQGGAAAKRIADFFKERNAGATGRVEDIINSQLSDGSLRDTAKQLAEARSTNARPLWDKAMAGGSIAPLERQFEAQFGEATHAVTDAQRRVINANARVTQSVGRQATGGNVYSDSAANAARKEANESLIAAQRDVQKAQADREAIRDRLRKAQADGSANAPGAVWSPRLQEFLDQPEVRKGLARGYAIERRRAVGEGKPFNPREYAVLGEDEAGEPIVGQVPNMRLLAVAKEGLDSIIESEGMKDPLTGRPNKTGLSYIKLRNGFEQELDRLNPDYKAARDQWAGDTATIRALQDGRNIFNDKRFTVEEIPEYVKGLNPSERQFFILGVADKLKANLLRKVDAADKGSIINTEDARRRITPLFGSEEAAEKFLADVERERVMKQTPTKVTGGSPTAERVAVDDMLRSAWNQAKHGHLVRALTAAGAHGIEHLAERMGRARQAEVNDAIARILTDPNVARQIWANKGKTQIVVPPPQ